MNTVNTGSMPMSLKLRNVLGNRLVAVVDSPVLEEVMIMRIGILRMVRDFPEPEAKGSLISLNLCLEVAVEEAVAVRDSVGKILTQNFISLFVMLQRLINRY